MSTTEKEAQEIETAKIELSGPGWQLSTTVSVPKGPMPARELLPLARMVAEKVVDYTSRSVEDEGQKISCKKGCGACCRQLVPIPEVEARHIRDLVNALPEPRRSEIRGRFAQARRRLQESGLLEKLLEREHWREDEVRPLGIKYFFQGIPCPFLEDESCSIHPDRPITCREYLVTSPAENCAQPGKDTIAQVELPFKIWPALARLEMPAAQTRFISWVPLILALDWADSHPAEPGGRPGPELLRNFFEQLSATQPKPTEVQPRSNGAAEYAGAQQSFQREFPLRLGDAKDFARVESALRELGFDEATICRRFAIQDMSDIDSIQRSKADLADLPGLILRLFLFLESIPSLELERSVEPALLNALVRLDLVRKGVFKSSDGNRMDAYYSPVWLYPVGDFLIASDRHANPDGSDFMPMPDIVFPGIYEGTLHFVNAVSKRSAENALELCTGCGIGALVLSRAATSVVACDITGRACHFTKFNVFLNHRANVATVQGDLYGGVGKREFDLVVAHPPYVPSLAPAMVYRDSGETGENLIERIITGLPEYLRSGGSFVGVCGGWDSSQGTFEERVLSWLGHRRDEFRLAFSREKEFSPEEAAARLPKLNDSPQGAASADWLAIFQAAGLKKRVYGTLVLQRT